MADRTLEKLFSDLGVTSMEGALEYLAEGVVDRGEIAEDLLRASIGLPPSAEASAEITKLADERSAALLRAEKAEGELVRFEAALKIDRRVALFSSVINEALQDDTENSLDGYLEGLYDQLVTADKALKEGTPMDTMGMVTAAGRLAAAAMVVVDERIEERTRKVVERGTSIQRRH